MRREPTSPLQVQKPTPAADQFQRSEACSKKSSVIEAGKVKAVARAALAAGAAEGMPPDPAREALVSARSAASASRISPDNAVWISAALNAAKK